MSVTASETQVPNHAQPNSDPPPQIIAAIRPDERIDGAESLLRAAHRLAGALKAQWTVVSVETSRSRWLPVPSGALIKEVWGPERDDARALRVYIGSLRRKLEADPSRPKYILTELGVGYRLAVDSEAS
jgi:two-component system KDP operon response regulator KdpE